jgi:hypothetical protein
MATVNKFGLTTQQVCEVGQHLVAAQIHLHGGYAPTFAGNMPGIDLLATDAELKRAVYIQVKTRMSGTWQADNRIGRRHRRRSVASETTFFVFVDLIDPARPEFYVVPKSWFEDWMAKENEAYLASHGGARPVNPNSHHAGIRLESIAEWKDQWEQLGLRSLAARAA